jgi:hypothetical protein
MKSGLKSQWESMTIDELFALREQMQEILSARLKAKKTEIERRLQQLNQRSKAGKLPDGLSTLLVTFGPVGYCLEASANCISALSF